MENEGTLRFRAFLAEAFKPAETDLSPVPVKPWGTLNLPSSPYVFHISELRFAQFLSQEFHLTPEQIGKIGVHVVGERPRRLTPRQSKFLDFSERKPSVARITEEGTPGKPRIIIYATHVWKRYRAIEDADERESQITKKIKEALSHEADHARRYPNIFWLRKDSWERFMQRDLEREATEAEKRIAGKPEWDDLFVFRVNRRAA